MNTCHKYYQIVLTLAALHGDHPVCVWAGDQITEVDNLGVSQARFESYLDAIATRFPEIFG